MRISDWSSDVCSSDLLVREVFAERDAGAVLVADDVGRPDVRAVGGFHAEVEAAGLFGRLLRVIKAYRLADRAVDLADDDAAVFPGVAGGGDVHDAQLGAQPAALLYRKRVG